jgi:uncharacterized protein (DUF433 family)
MSIGIEKQHIVATPGTCGGKPRVDGTRIRVMDIFIWCERMGCSPEEVVATYPQLTLGDVHAALAYYHDHSEEIEASMQEAHDFVERMKSELGPGPLEQKLREMGGNGASVSS